MPFRTSTGITPMALAVFLGSTVIRHGAFNLSAEQSFRRDIISVTDDYVSSDCTLNHTVITIPPAGEKTVVAGGPAPQMLPLLLLCLLPAVCPLWSLILIGTMSAYTAAERAAVNLESALPVHLRRVLRAYFTLYPAVEISVFLALQLLPITWQSSLDQLQPVTPTHFLAISLALLQSIHNKSKPLELADQVLQLQDQVVQLRETIRKKAKKAETQIHNLEGLRSASEQKRLEEREELELAVTHLQQRINQLEEACESLGLDKESARREARSYRDRIAALENDNHELEKLKVAQAEEIRDGDDVIGKLRGDVAAEKKKYDALSKRKDELAAAESQSRLMAVDAQTKYNDAQAKCNRLSKTNSELQANVRAANRRADEIAAEKKQVEQDGLVKASSQANARYEALQTEYNAVSEQIARLEADVVEANRRAAESVAEKQAELDGALSQATAEYKALQSKYDMLSKKSAQFEGNVLEPSSRAAGTAAEKQAELDDALKKQGELERELKVAHVTIEGSKSASELMQGRIANLQDEVASNMRAKIELSRAIEKAHTDLAADMGKIEPTLRKSHRLQFEPFQFSLGKSASALKKLDELQATVLKERRLREESFSNVVTVYLDEVSQKNAAIHDINTKFRPEKDQLARDIKNEQAKLQIERSDNLQLKSRVAALERLVQDSRLGSIQGSTSDAGDVELHKTKTAVKNLKQELADAQAKHQKHRVASEINQERLKTKVRELNEQLASKAQSPDPLANASIDDAQAGSSEPSTQAVDGVDEETMSKGQRKRQNKKVRNELWALAHPFEVLEKELGENENTNDATRLQKKVVESALTVLAESG